MSWDPLIGLQPTSLPPILFANFSTDGAEEVQIRRCRYIGSYNWLDSNDGPKIIVPGAPRLWSENPLPIQITPDVGEQFIDQNGSRMKGRPLIPLVKAVEKVTASTFAWGDVDFVTDRSNLRKLWRWSNGTVSKRGPFRIDTQLVGTTILLKRVERAVIERMSGYTFGFSFEEKFTVPAPGCEGTTGHHRIVNYDLNGLNMVVRFELDACTELPGHQARGGSTAAKEPVKLPIGQSTAAPARGAGFDDVLESFGSLSIGGAHGGRQGIGAVARGPGPERGRGRGRGRGQGGQPAAADTGLQNISEPLVIIEGGTGVDDDKILEMATRKDGLIDARDACAQLWLSQTPEHRLGIHRAGLFTEIRSTKISLDAPDTEQAGLKKMRRLLEEIKTIIFQNPEERLTFVSLSGDSIEVYARQNRQDFLPSEEMAVFSRVV